MVATSLLLCIGTIHKVRLMLMWLHVSPVRVTGTERYMGLGCLGDRYIIIKNIARLVFDIRLIVLIAVPVVGYISIESQRKRNADVPCFSEVC